MEGSSSAGVWPQPANFKRRPLHLTVGTDVPTLRRKRLVSQPGNHPVGDQPRRIGTEICGWDIADGMPRFLIHDELAWALHGCNHALRPGQRAEFLCFAGYTKIGHTDALGITLPRQCLTEGIEPALVGNSRHIHEALFVCWGSLLENRMEARL